METTARFALAALGLAALAGSASAQPTELIAVDPADYRYRLSQSTEAIDLWTQPVADKVHATDTAPAALGSGLALHAARREYESAVLVLSAATNVAISIAPFGDLGPDQQLQLELADFSGGVIELLDPLASPVGHRGVPTVVWITVFVPPGAAPGLHTTTLTVTPEGAAAIEVPVTLDVFDFELPAAIHFDSRIDVSMSQPEEELKDTLFGLRLTPATPTWPSGFHSHVTWDTSANPNQCESFWDDPLELPQFSLAALAPKYVLGTGWNGVGLPSALAFDPTNFPAYLNPRPDPFCGQSVGANLFGTTAYNTEWQAYLAGLEGYLAAHGMADRVYALLLNEPQTQIDYDLAAHLCRLAREAAPSLRIAITEEPKPAIAEAPGTPCSFDIWVAHLPSADLPYAATRQTLGEELWLYALPSDDASYPSPIHVDAPGNAARIEPWLAWTLRARGLYLPELGPLLPLPGPPYIRNRHAGVRAVLLREGFEDYEYLWLANGSSQPQPGTPAAIDASVASAATGATSWESDAARLQALRTEIGRFLEGSRATLPVLAPEPGAAAGAVALAALAALARRMRRG